jgi:hydrogenase nickel incorporation protein HypB
MCKECGCGLDGGDVKIGGHSHEHDHGHGHHHHHDHDYDHAAGKTVNLNRSLMEKNDRLAERNRGFFRAKKLLVLNVVSSPGSGKTTFIRETAARLAGQLRVGVIVGDLATDNDATQLRKLKIPVVQITTGTVGNLVCPADYDLGEDLRIVLLSVTEGEDKPVKYPPIFHSANVAVLTKSDLAAAAGFNREQALANLKRISHHAHIFELSAKTGEGMEAWLKFLVKQRAGGQF